MCYQFLRKESTIFTTKTRFSMLFDSFASQSRSDAYAGQNTVTVKHIVILLIYKYYIGAIDGIVGQIQWLAKVLVSCIEASHISLFCI